MSLAALLVGAGGRARPSTTAEFVELQRQWGVLAAYDRPLLDGLVVIEGRPGSHTTALAQAYGQAGDGLAALEQRLRRDPISDRRLRALRDQMAEVIDLHVADLESVEAAYRLDQRHSDSPQPPTGVTLTFVQEEATVQQGIDEDARHLGVGPAAPVPPVEYPALELSSRHRRDAQPGRTGRRQPVTCATPWQMTRLSHISCAIQEPLWLIGTAS